MRSIVNISMPTTLKRDVEKAVKLGGYSTTSEFFRHLLRLWNSQQLAEELKRDRKKFQSGKGKILRSLRDLR